MNRHTIVIDTNVIFSALRSRQGMSYALMSQIHRQDIQIAISVPLIIEYEKVLLEHQNHLVFSLEELTDYLDYICTIALHHKIHYLWRPILKDPKDDMVLEVAVAANSRFIITFNKKDFVGSEKFGVSSVTPKEFLLFLERGVSS